MRRKAGVCPLMDREEMPENLHVTRRRAFALLLVVALGLISRRYPIGLLLYDKSLGDVLYAAAVYLAIGLLRPRWPILALAGAAFAVCLAVEAFQLTGLPARYAYLPPVRWLLGTHFAWEDIGCYLAGVVGIAAMDRGAARLSPASGRAGSRRT